MWISKVRMRVFFFFFAIQLDKIASEKDVRAELESLTLKQTQTEAKEQAAATEGMWR